jgi:catechol 2,3-dioxygenase-like lactoylglutathione lyase family enzyme
MHIKRQATILFVENLERSKVFYTQVLGFEVEMDFSSVVFYSQGLATWQLNVEEKLPQLLGTDFYKGQTHPFELYYEIFDFAEQVEKIKATDFTLVHDVHEESHGQRTIRFYDPDNNIIELGEPLEVFIKRDADSGMTLKELAKKHILSENEIENLLK